MNISLSQIQFKLDEVRELRRDALNTVRLLALGRMDADKEMRLALVSKFEAYEREFWALVKIERELIASGRPPSREPRTANPILTETRFNAPPPPPAVLTPKNQEDAANGPRDTREAGSLPPAGDAF